MKFFVKFIFKISKIEILGILNDPPEVGIWDIVYGFSFWEWVYFLGCPVFAVTVLFLLK